MRNLLLLLATALSLELAVCFAPASSFLGLRCSPAESMYSQGSRRQCSKANGLACAMSLDKQWSGRREAVAALSIMSQMIIRKDAFAEEATSAQQSGSEWADHVGAFTDAEFTGFSTSPSGLKYKDIVAGTGDQPKDGDSVRLHYSGYLMDGTKFDSSYRGALFPFSLLVKDAPPVAFKLEKGSLIPGFLEGVLGMKVGGRRIVLIPSSLGYGERGASGVIPPNSALVFYIELRKVGSGIIL